MIAGKDATRMGEAKNSWLTGTSAWNYVAISQAILGILPDTMPVVPGQFSSAIWGFSSVGRLAVSTEGGFFMHLHGLSGCAIMTCHVKHWECQKLALTAR